MIERYFIRLKIQHLNSKKHYVLFFVQDVYSEVYDVLFCIHKYLRQFRYSYWWRERHVGVYKPLLMTSKKI